MARLTKWLAVLPFVFGTVGSASGQMQTLPGASQADADRHYLIHLADLKSQQVAGTTNPTDTATAITIAIEFKAWFMSAITTFNATQATITDVPTANAAMAQFKSMRDDEVESYMSQLNARLSLQGQHQVARYVKATIPKMKTGVDFPTKAESQSAAGLGGGNQDGNFSCPAGSPPYDYTCSVTYSLAGVNSGLSTNVMEDTFSRSNGGLGSNWTALYGTFGVSGDAATVTNGGSGGSAFAYYNANTPTPDQVVDVQLQTLPSSGASIGICNRMGTSGQNGYCVVFYIGSFTGLVFQKIVNGSLTNQQYYAYGMAVGDDLKIVASKNYISVWLNSNQVMAMLDTSLTSGRGGLIGTQNGGSVVNFHVGSMGTTFMYNPVFDGNESMEESTGAEHTPIVSVNGSQQDGTAVCPNCYLYAEGFYDLPILQGTEVGVSDVAIIHCSIGGPFFNTGGNYGITELAYTRVYNDDEGMVLHGPIYGYTYAWQVPADYYGMGGNKSSFQYQLYGSGVTTNGGGTWGPAYGYQVLNQCTEAQLPDANMNSFKAVLPEGFYVGGTFCSGTFSQACSGQQKAVIAPQGQYLEMYTMLWSNGTGGWDPTPWWLDEIIFFSNPFNEIWNEPVAAVIPMLILVGDPGSVACTSNAASDSGSVIMKNAGKTM